MRKGRERLGPKICSLPGVSTVTYRTNQGSRLGTGRPPPRISGSTRGRKAAARDRAASPRLALLRGVLAAAGAARQVHDVVLLRHLSRRLIGSPIEREPALTRQVGQVPAGI